MPLRLVAPLAVFVFVAVLVTGCGDSSSDETSVPPKAPVGATAKSCLIRSYRCQATSTDRGFAVSCARAGQSIAFIVKP